MASKGFIELLRLADLAKARKTGRHESTQSQWLGVIFELGGRRMIAPMGEISEVLFVPQYTAVPLTAPWLMGVANVRGRLLPLIDLGAFLGIKHQGQGRILMVDSGVNFFGLLVDTVIGIGQYTERDYLAKAPENEAFALFAPFLHGQFAKDQHPNLPIFLPSLLAKNSKFANASALSY